MGCQFLMLQSPPYVCHLTHFIMGLVASLLSPILIDSLFLSYQVIEHIMVGPSDNIALDLGIYTAGRICSLMMFPETSTWIS